MKKMNKNNNTLKPFIKWVGGKGQLLADIRNSYPKELGKKITKYAEPFIGGGAVLFDILSNYELKEVYISDINAELINTYKSIQNAPQQIICLLEQYQNEYVPMDSDSRKEYYYIKRDRFNSLKTNGNNDLNIEKGALFVFLNKTCFNGLYRVNKNGLYNVPMGSYKNPCICDKENLLNVSKALQNVIMHCGSYLDCENFIDENTFIYIDPPYRPLTDTSNFTSYTKFEFGDKEQIELADFATRLRAINSKVILSNSDPKNSDENDDFFDNLYKDFIINRVSATRMINSNSNSRGKINELLIANY